MIKKNPDAIIVLAGGTSFDMTRRRMDCAMRAWSELGQPMMVLSGGYSFILETPPPLLEAEAMQRYAVSTGFPPDKILIETESRDTLGNAFFTKRRLAEPRSWRNLLIVTSEYHLPRTRYVFQKVFGPLYSLSYRAAASHFSELESLEHRAEEKLIFEISAEALNAIPDGDDRAIEHFLYTKHPGYVPEAHPTLKHLLRLVLG